MPPQANDDDVKLALVCPSHEVGVGSPTTGDHAEGSGNLIGRSIVRQLPQQRGLGLR